MRRALLEHGLLAYRDVREWVYPPGFMPWLLGGIWIGDHLGLPRDFVLRLPPILADGVLTFIVMETLRQRRASARLTIAAGSLIAFGPMFLAVSSYQGQTRYAGDPPRGGGNSLGGAASERDACTLGGR